MRLEEGGRVRRREVGVTEGGGQGREPMAIMVCNHLLVLIVSRCWEFKPLVELIHEQCWVSVFRRLAADNDQTISQ